MHYNIISEYVSLVTLFILVVYSYEYNPVLTLKNKLFRVCLYFTIFSISASIASILSIENKNLVPLFINQMIQTVYFLSSAMVAVLFLYYTISVIWDEPFKYRRLFLIISIPYMLYAIAVLFNIKNEFLSVVSESTYFAPGPGYILAYIVPGFYTFGIIVLVFVMHKKMDRSLAGVLMSFPVISIIILLLQWVLDTVILSGLAAASSLLIVYLYLQNKQTEIDALTGLQNRKAFSKVLEMTIKKRVEVGIILVSLDDFKLINDRLGHMYGNQLLIDISRYLRTIVPIKSIYRYGGDEFIILIEKNDTNEGTSIIERINERFTLHWGNETQLEELSTSIALVNIPDDADKFESIITLLEYCIDLSKKNGKSQMILCNKEIVEKLRRKTQIIDRIDIALKEKSFEMYYQPIYHIAENRYKTARLSFALQTLN